MSTIIKFADNTTIKLTTTLDVTPNQNATISTHKVEDGSDIADNIHIGAIRVSVRGIVANTKQGPDFPTNNAIDFANKLESVYKKRELVTVITSRAMYKNYAIENFTLPIQKGFGADIPINISFKEIQTALTQTTRLPAAAFKTKTTAGRFAKRTDKGQGTKTDPTGKQTTKTNQVIAKPKSALASIVDFFK